MISVFEAFAGIGGFRSGLERVGGFKIVGWCEIDKFAQKAYRILFDTGKEEFYEDITKIDYRTMPDFDLLVEDGSAFFRSDGCERSVRLSLKLQLVIFNRPDAIQLCRRAAVFHLPDIQVAAVGNIKPFTHIQSFLSH